MSLADGGQLSTVFEDPRTKQNKELRVRESSSLTGLLSKAYKTPSGNSRDASPGSAVEKVYSEKAAEQPPRRLKHKPQSIGVREQNAWSRDATPLQNGTYRDSMAPEFPKPESHTKKTKNRSLKTIIRRMFGKGSVKNRISLPAPITYQNVSRTPNQSECQCADCRPGPEHVHHVGDRSQDLTFCISTDSRGVTLQCPWFACSLQSQSPSRYGQPGDQGTTETESVSYGADDETQPVSSSTAEETARGKLAKCHPECARKRRADRVRPARRAGSSCGWGQHWICRHQW